jgi:hypothetical protein
VKRRRIYLIALLLGLALLLVACAHPTAPPPRKDPYKDPQTCLDMGGQWGPWIDYLGCKFPEKKP